MNTTIKNHSKEVKETFNRSNEFWVAYKKGDKHELQKLFCIDRDLPLFVPLRKCNFCGKNIWKEITKEFAGSKHITGCPICNASFCE